MIVSGGVANVGNFPSTQNVTFSSTWQVDALGALRTSTTQNQEFYLPTVDNDTFFRWSELLNGTNSNTQYLANTSEIQMTSGNTSVGSAALQTFVRFKIVPGSSHVVYTTINFTANTTETGVTRRFGLFDTYNGMFWEQTANTLAVVVRRQLANGAVVEDRTYSNTFSVDPLNGTGPSGFNIFSHGLNNYYTFWFDFIGGRTGRIRFGTGVPSGPQICHVASYSGNNSNTVTFITDNSLPLRREIFNTTAQTVSPTFNLSSVAIEYESPTLFTSFPTTAYNILGYVPSTTLAPILTIGLRSGTPYSGSDIQPIDFSLVDQVNQGKNSNPATFFYQLIYNANVNGTYAYSGNGATSTTNIGRSSCQWTWANTATLSGEIGRAHV